MVATACMQRVHERLVAVPWKCAVSECSDESEAQLSLSIGRGPRRQRGTRGFGGQRGADPVHEAFRGRHRSWVDAQLANPESDERERHQRLRRHFSAHRNVDALRVGDLVGMAFGDGF